MVWKRLLSDCCSYKKNVHKISTQKFKVVLNIGNKLLFLHFTKRGFEFKTSYRSLR